EPVDEVDEELAFPDVAGTVDQRLVSANDLREIGLPHGVEVTFADGRARPRVAGQLRGRADERGQLVSGVQRQAKRVAAQRPGGSEDDDASHRLAPRGG